MPRPKLSKEQKKARKLHRKTMDAAVAAVSPEVKPDPTHHVNGNRGRVERPYVARNANGNTTIVLFRARTKVYHVPMESEGLRVYRTPMDTFDSKFLPWDYPTQKAAQSYLDWSNQYLGLTDIARDALTAITKGEVDMSNVETTSTSQSEPTKPTATTAGKKTVSAKKPSKAIVKKSNGETKAKTAKPKAAKTAKPKAKAKPKSEKTSSGNRLDESLKISKVAKENPRREGTGRAARFDAYREGMSVAKALEYEAITSAGIRRDVEEGLIKLVK